MRLLCIKSCIGGQPPKNGSLIEENVYESIDQEEKPGHGLVYLIFIEEDNEYWYTAEHFIPLSDKDETEYADEVLTRMFQPVKF